MPTLLRLARHSRWANRIVLDLCSDLDSTALVAPVSGTIGSIRQTLEHLIWIEHDCLEMLGGRPQLGTADEILARLAEYRQLDFASLRARGDEVAAGLEQAIEAIDAAALDEPLLRTPAISRRDWLLHVLTHSAHHRAQVLTALGQRGVAVPDVDYVFYLLGPGQGG